MRLWQIALSTLILLAEFVSIIWLNRENYIQVNLSDMTTNLIYREFPGFTSIDLTPISSDENEDWLHPILEIFRPLPMQISTKIPKLYLVPSSFNDEFDPDFAPEPTSAKDLPELEEWNLNFARNVLEIFAGRRQPTQLTKQCHHHIFAELLIKSGSEKEIGRIRKIHITEPLDGICESAITVRFGERLRCLILRFEGVDKRWLCTSLTLL